MSDQYGGLNDFLRKIEKINNDVPSQHIDTLNFFDVEIIRDDENDKSGYRELLLDYNFSNLIQRITLPEVVDSIQQSDSLFGKFPSHSLIVFPTTNELIFEVINTREANIDNIIDKWLHEVHSVKWRYLNIPYSTIRIEVSLTSHTDIKYVFLNCRPITMKSHIVDQQLRNSITREITFTFDYMYLKFPVIEKKYKEQLERVERELEEAAKSEYHIHKASEGE